MTKKRTRTVWTPAMDAIMVRDYPNQKTEQVAATLDLEVSKVYSRAYALGLAKSPEFLASPASGRLTAETQRLTWTPEQDQQIRDRYPHEETAVLAAAMGLKPSTLGHRAKELNVSKTRDHLAGLARKHLTDSGKAYRFPKGNVPWTKGMKGLRMSPGTEFKKGQRPRNYAAVGSRKMHMGYQWIKVQDGGWPNAWRPEHHVVWEQHHGQRIPAGHVLRFADENRFNFAPENLVLATKADLMRSNTIQNLPTGLVEVIRLKTAVVREIKKQQQE
jgi:hypothetical protein